MGQYYRTYLKTERGKEIFLDAGMQLDGDWKLTEQALWSKKACNTIAKMLYHAPHTVVWAGDYSAADIPYGDLSKEDSERILRKLWGEDIKDSERGLEKAPDPAGFTLDGKFFADHNKKEYINCDAYKEKSLPESGCVAFTIHPLPILTCAGNGPNGGDYLGTNMDMVGSWCGDTVSVEDEAPKGYKELDCFFLEGAEGGAI